jgi:heme-degrading monooxygenase HmoA
VVVCVFARVSEWPVPPERQDEALRAAEEHIGPALMKQAGYCGDLLLGDKQDGKMLTVTLWEDEQAMRATDEASHWFRSYGAWQTGGRAESTGHYEVYRAQDLEGRSSSSIGNPALSTEAMQAKLGWDLLQGTSENSVMAKFADFTFYEIG